MKHQIKEKTYQSDLSESQVRDIVARFNRDVFAGSDFNLWAEDTGFPVAEVEEEPETKKVYTRIEGATMSARAAEPMTARAANLLEQVVVSGGQLHVTVGRYATAPATVEALARAGYIEIKRKSAGLWFVVLIAEIIEATLLPGDNVGVTSVDNPTEPAVVIEPAEYLPAGWWRVQFSDGGRLVCHEERINLQKP